MVSLKSLIGIQSIVKHNNNNNNNTCFVSQVLIGGWHKIAQNKIKPHDVPKISLVSAPNKVWWELFNIPPKTTQCNWSWSLNVFKLNPISLP